MASRSLGQAQLIALVVVAVLVTALPATVVQVLTHVGLGQATDRSATALPSRPHCPVRKSFSSLRIVSSEEVPKYVAQELIRTDEDIAKAVKLLLGNRGIKEVIAVRHKVIVNGYPGTLLAIGVISDGKVMVYYRYALPNHHVRNVAYLYTIEGKYGILQKIYVNGKVVASSCPHECNSDSDCESVCGIANGGCVSVCCRVDWYKAAECCAHCAEICIEGGPEACLACLLIWCPICVVLNCEEWGTSCECMGIAP